MTLNTPVRPDILTSWQRCVVAGLRPDRFEVPYQPDLDDDGPLRWAAAPILDQVADELEGTGVGLLLTDARGQIVDRRAADTSILTRLDHIELAPGFLYSEPLIGTNAIGTAIAQQAPSVVTATEHFADALTSMACAAIPVTDGAGEMVGVIDLTCAAEDFNPMMLPFAKRTAQGIGERLREGTPRLPVGGWLSLTDTERGWLTCPRRVAAARPWRTGWGCPSRRSARICGEYSASSASGPASSWPGSSSKAPPRPAP